jgi:hypothetical protein
MELLRWFVEGLWTLLQMYFGFWTRLGDAVTEAFELSMPPQLMRVIMLIIGVGFLAGGIGRVLQWDRHGHQPQAIRLYTAQTANQVVQNDLRNLLWLLVRATAVGIALALLISSVLPAP